MGFYYPEIRRFDISMLTPNDGRGCLVAYSYYNIKCTPIDECTSCIFYRDNKEHTLKYLIRAGYISKEEALTLILDGF